MTRSPSELPGLDLKSLEEWFHANRIGLFTGSLRGEVIAGGKSNLTYLVTDGQRTLVLRRPPLGHVLATAHDMTREARVMGALYGSAVPVPEVVAACGDATVLGAPFYLMEHVDGSVFRRASELASLGTERAASISSALVETLVRLHQVEPASVGLQDFGRPDGFLTRQVRRWKMQFDSSHCRDLADLEPLHSQLLAHVPPSGPVGIVHGDYRLDNVLIDHRDRPIALIDWEMSTLGDTLTDLAMFIVYRRAGELAGGDAVADASSAPGFIDEATIIEQYARGTGRELDGIGFYIALASFKLAGIFEGIHYRYLEGQTVGPGFDKIGDLTEPLLSAGIQTLKESF